MTIINGGTRDTPLDIPLELSEIPYFQSSIICPRYQQWFTPERVSEGGKEGGGGREESSESE